VLDINFVITVHDEIIAELGGLPGLSGGGIGAVESALTRVEMHAHYAEAIARGHVFNDANKRTALTCALTYLYQEGIIIPEVPELEEVMVRLASGDVSGDEFADFLNAIWEKHQKPSI
jgi:death-on-curing protein